VAPLERLLPVDIAVIEILRVRMELAVPFRTPHREGDTHRDVLLVHVKGREVEGWAECAVEPAPSYSGEFTDATVAVFEHLLRQAMSTPPEVRWDRPGAEGGRGPIHPLNDAWLLGRALEGIRGHPIACAAVELAVLDAQLRQADRSLAGWLGATAATVPAGAALSLHESVDELLAEADSALAAGAARLRVKIAPGHAAEPLQALRDHVGSDVILQADANGSFGEDDDELVRLDDVGLACLEQPLSPDDLLGHARLADRLDTPICLDEPLTSLAAIEAAIHVGACEVVCLKPARVGGWIKARAVHDRCAELGVPAWIGGLLETGIGRAANLAAAALPHLALPSDLDPRVRYVSDLADPRLPVDGVVPVPTGPGTDAVPSAEALADAEVVRAFHLWSL
jgi:O-succinylbenzoate synthase